ncbi:helix-turn-helix transcriptional regulator [Pseudomonas aeruginosa]|uniref:helix-turn-helix transcriptional regulator n=2 Tax=Pseudomonas aeruginosa group TaxID=136841 RepID=UPI000E69D0A7|nr:WYL domain-containing protein [Pseudomonas aeruginosa]MDG9819126.1 WYL domain-containing protein [Pseudomonas aeruginosa]MDG9933694.1 WYL domain-containing protein [Pseudomonas aeruginosa]MDH0530163.1 WYL domain-containing protein [Pseudomonas aeruginosa]MDH0535799.1 WYL domain-containing protein [Pseudomonas aeruginosa]WKA36218.1 WYL domain-containing protein [Pseudomonas aeruginosa]
MSQAKDTLLRLFALLRLIPTAPQRIATPTLLEKLRDRGFSVTLRSIQRDLNRLSIPFSLQCDDSEIPFRWSFTRDAPLDLEDMDAPTALALYLSESHLNPLLPQTVLDQLGPQFRRARNFLNGLGGNGLADWSRRVRAIPNGKTLLPAALDLQVWGQVSAGLLERRQLQVTYQSRSKGAIKHLRLHPAGLVSRHTISYLLASVEGYKDLRQFALHRIKKVELLDEPANQHTSFDVDLYIRQDLNASSPIQQVELVADISPQIAWLLSETPLGPQQSMSPLPNTDWQNLRVPVPNDQETLWWVFGLGENARVYKPEKWSEEIKQKAARLVELYKS